MTIEDIAARLHATKTSTGYEALCPAHKDKRPSLSISSGNDGRILLKCHRGCDTKDVLAAAGLKMADLFPARDGDSQPRQPRKIVARYAYQDESGALLFEALRYDPKGFSQGHYEAGRWVPGIKSIRRVLYRLPEVCKAIKQGLPILIAEGEKDVATLVQRGFCATCNPMGAGKWEPEYAEVLRGADCIIIADKDGPKSNPPYAGQRHAETIADSLAQCARRVRVILLPEVQNAFKAGTKDATDYFDLGGTAEDLIALIDAAPDWVPGTKIAPTDNAESEVPWLDLLEDAAQIVKEDLPPVVELIEGLVTDQSKVVIASGAKSNKTWLTIDASLSIAHGVPFLGRDTLQRTVLYVNFELKGTSYKRRIQIVARAKGISIDHGTFIHLPLRGQVAGLPVSEIISRIIAIAQHVKAGVVVIDPVYKLNVEGDENSSRDQTVLYNQIDRVTTEAKCAVILNDHFSKGNQSEKDPLDAIRGSSAKGGDVDAAIILRRHDVEDCFRVDVIHRELAPVAPFVIGWNFPLMELRRDLDPENMKKAKAGRSQSFDPRELLGVIYDNTEGNPISISAWAHAAGMARQTLSDALPKMRVKGWVSTVGDGNNARQIITEKGREIAKEIGGRA